jgi:hypothetical protein
MTPHTKLPSSKTQAKKHNVFKVETIGDAYMGVTNLDGSQFDNHVKCIAEFAIDIVEAASTILIDDEDPGRGYVQVRVGFHSGPVVSNVIGSLNPRFGLFGDTVNTGTYSKKTKTRIDIICPLLIQDRTLTLSFPFCSFSCSFKNGK